MSSLYQTDQGPFGNEMKKNKRPLFWKEFASRGKSARGGEAFN